MIRTVVLERVVAEHGESLGVFDLGENGILLRLRCGVVHGLKP